MTQELFVVLFQLFVFSNSIFEETFFNQKWRDDLDKWEQGTDVFIRSYGYEFEFKNFTTTDGVVIGLHHVWNSSTPTPRVPVLLLTGIFADGDSFFLNNVEDNFFLFLATQGYDLWAMNYRGSIYSKIDDNAWMNTTIDDSMHHDVAEGIDFILKETSQPNLNIFSISKGTTIVFSLLACRPEYNEKVRLNVAFVPVTYIDQPVLLMNLYMYVLYEAITLNPDSTSSLKFINSNVYINWLHWPFVPKLIQGLSEILPGVTTCVLNLLWTGKIDCTTPTVFDRTLIAKTFTRGFPTNVWAHELMQFAQNSFSNRLQEYSDAWLTNGPRAPITTEYDMSRVTAPHIIVEDDREIFSQPKDYKRIREQLCSVLIKGDYFDNQPYSLKVDVLNYQHVDVVVAKNNFNIYGHVMYMLMREHDLKLNSSLLLPEIKDIDFQLIRRNCTTT